MSKAKWFVTKKPSTGEIIATSANQIAEIPQRYINVVLYSPDQTPFPLGGVEGGSGDETNSQRVCGTSREKRMSKHGISISTVRCKASWGEPEQAVGCYMGG